MLVQKYNKKFNKFLRKSLTRLYDKTLPPPTQRENELVQELRDGFSQLPVLETANRSDSERQWINNSNTLRQLILEDDPREFLRWHVVSSAMFVKYSAYIHSEFRYLKKRPDWNNRWSEAIRESTIGHPIPYYKFPKSSANLIHHAYHLAVFEERTARYVNDLDFIFEFGGGYGSMCRLFHNLGFNGRYMIYDLPAFCILQQYYLKSIGINVKSDHSSIDVANEVVCISEIQRLKEIFSRDIEKKNSMFIATWSISESPVHIRDFILPFVSDFNNIFIAYQAQFHEVNNVNFFKDWRAGQKKFEWMEWEIEHMPGNRYLTGKRKEK